MRSEQAESERGFLALGRDEPSPRIDLISENEPRRAHVTPRRDRERDLGSQLVSARLGNLGNPVCITQSAPMTVIGKQNGCYNCPILQVQRCITQSVRSVRILNQIGCYN